MLIGSASLAFAQRDSLVLKNGDVIVGEIKSLDKAVLMMGTDYSKNDLAIKWNGIREIYTSTRFLVTLKDGARINGTIQSQDGGRKIILTDNAGTKTENVMDNIVQLKGIKSDFWSRLL